MKLNKVDKGLIVAFTLLILFTVYNKYLKTEKWNKHKTKILWLPKKEINIGKIPFINDTTFNCIIKNDSTNNLYIQEVSSTCGCTKYKVNKRMIKPYDTTNISITIKPQYIGKNTTAIILKTNTISKVEGLSIIYEAY